MDEETFLVNCAEIVQVSEGEWEWHGDRGLRRRVENVVRSTRQEEAEEEEADASLGDDTDTALATDAAPTLLCGIAYLSHSAAFGCPIVSFVPTSHSLSAAASLLPPTFSIGPCPLTGSGALVLHPCETATVLKCMREKEGESGGREWNATLRWLSAFGPALGLTVPLAWLTPP